MTDERDEKVQAIKRAIAAVTMEISPTPVEMLEAVGVVVVGVFLKVGFPTDEDRLHGFDKWSEAIRHFLQDEIANGEGVIIDREEEDTEGAADD